MRVLDGEQTLVRIFIGEADHHHHFKALYLEILTRLRKEGFAGATIFRGVASFGAASVIHTSNIVDLSTDLPMLIEVVDDQEHIDKLLLILDELITKGALITMEKVRVIKYAPGEPRSTRNVNEGT